MKLKRFINELRTQVALFILKGVYDTIELCSYDMKQTYYVIIDADGNRHNKIVFKQLAGKK